MAYHTGMKRKHLLAAEVFGYSFENYENHLGIGHVRYEQMMPNDVRLLEQAEREGWDDARVARELEIEPQNVARYRKAIRHALFIVDAPTAAETFRRSVQVAIENALGERLAGEAEVAALVEQICYRAADFGFLLDREGKRLSDYSKQLRLGSDPASEDDTSESDRP